MVKKVANEKPNPQAQRDMICNNCAQSVRGEWSQSPKGVVCARCYHFYLRGAWPQPAA